MKNIAIQVENMSKSFKVYYDKANTLKEKLMFWKRSKGEVREVLKDINLTITKGETVALVGTNGCGKSTLLKLMTKIIYPTKGKIKTNGTLTSLLELGAGFHPDFTGRENIYFNASIFGLTKKEIDTFKNDTIYIELASFPGGIDKHYAKSKNINIIVASKLPSRYSKETAGYLIGEAIDKMIKEGKV